jgi:hypothetical protein
MSQETITDAASSMSMYCVKCRTTVTVTAPKRVVLKNDRHALKGSCPHCSTSTYRIIPRD